MSCTALQNEVSALRSRRNGQAKLVEMMPNGPGRLRAQEMLDGLNADLAAAEAALDLCLARAAQETDPKPQYILGTVEKIQSHAASKEWMKEEPYLLIASFDMRPLTLGINVVKIGPWSGIDSNDTGYASHLAPQNNPAFWDLNGQGSPIAHPEDVIFLVALLERDGSSPDNIRGAVRAELLAAQVTNTTLAYTAYVTNMISNMTGTIETSRLLPGKPSLNVDDLIEGVKHLSLSTGDLANLHMLTPVTKTLRFTQRKANGNAVNDYTVWFSFTV